MSDHNTKGGFVGGIAVRAEDVTKSDATIFSASQIYIGTTGDVAVRTTEGDVVTFVGALAGMTLPVLVDKVLSTGTTASDIIRIY